MSPRISAASTGADLFLGFGSFHFQATTAAPDTFTGRDYLGWIEEILNRLPRATVIDVSSVEPTYAGAAFGAPGDDDAYSETAVPYPPLDFCSIKFALELPGDVQREVLEEGSPEDGDPETFVVSIRDGWEMPVAMVWPLEATSPAQASAAVRTVREYMRKVCGDEGAPIQFDCIGPSPAHFTVRLTDGDTTQDADFQFVARDSRPYPNYSYAYHPMFGIPAVAAEQFHFEITSQLDLMYRIEAARISQGVSWAAAESGARRILQAYEAKGVRAAFQRLAQGRHIRRVLIRLVEVELNQDLNHKRLATQFAGDYSEPREIDIEEVVGDQLNSFETIQTEPLSKLLEALDAGRQTGRSVLIAAIASLIGAVVAAVATIIAS